MTVDFSYSPHRRTVNGISGTTLDGKPFVTTDTVTVQENRVNFKVRSVTVLSDGGPRGRAVVRLRGESARY